MKLLLAFLLAGMVWLSGCMTKPPDVATDYDPITGQRTDLLSENILESPQKPPREVLWLNGSRVFRDWRNRQGTYYLEVTYMARTDTGYLNIPAGSTLTITADGQEMTF